MVKIIFQQCMACIQWCPQNAITHPALKVHRKLYTHPDVLLEQLWRKNEGKKEIENLANRNNGSCSNLYCPIPTFSKLFVATSK